MRVPTHPCHHTLRRPNWSCCLLCLTPCLATCKVTQIIHIVYTSVNEQVTLLLAANLFAKFLVHTLKDDASKILCHVLNVSTHFRLAFTGNLKHHVIELHTTHRYAIHLTIQGFDTCQLGLDLC